MNVIEHIIEQAMVHERSVGLIYLTASFACKRELDADWVCQHHKRNE
jgi:hypothetical protein